MTNKELEIELNKLKAEIKALKGETPTLKIKDIKVGEKFKYKDLEFTKLNENGLSIINTYKNNMDCPFDNINSNYEKSLIRYFINNRFCELFNINKDDLEEVNDWGDKLTLLSLEEYKTYRDIIPNINGSWWLRSPSGYYDEEYVSGNGSISDYYVDNIDVGSRPALIFKSDTMVSQS